MARRRYYRRRRPRRYIRRYIRRRIRRAVNASSRSRIRLKVPVQFAFSVQVSTGQRISSIASFNPWVTHVPSAGEIPGDKTKLIAGAAHSQLYQTYCALYDSVKLEGCKFNFAITSQVGGAGADFTSLQVYSAWDRSFGPAELYSNYPNGTQLTALSSYSSSTAINNSVAKLSRSIWASDLFEKAKFVDTDNTTVLASTSATARTHANSFLNTTTFGVDQGPPASYSSLYVNDAFVGGGFDSNYDKKKSVSFFSPTLYLAVATAEAPASDKTVSFVGTAMYYFTFRNPKYGGGGSTYFPSAKETDRMLAPDFSAGGDADADMDLDDESYAPEAPDLPDDINTDRVPVTSLRSAEDTVERRSVATTAARAATRAADQLARRTKAKIGTAAAAAASAVTAAAKDAVEDEARSLGKRAAAVVLDADNPALN